MKINKVLLKRLLWIICSIFVFLNLLAITHAYKFTHFTDKNIEKTKSPEQLSVFSKFETLFLGVNNPRPENTESPAQSYEIIILNSNKKIECWLIKTENSKGTVVLFHGYGGKKSALIDKSEEFLKLGYNTFLVDFMGSGESEGNQTTIGFYEAEQVKTCFDFLEKNGENNIILFGTSMGAVAILKAIDSFKINPSAIIIECPFSSMLETVSARFRTMKIPTFPMANLLVFWGGIENGFWGFWHNPQEYAKSVKCPTLLLYGQQDEKVSEKETFDIFNNLQGEKVLKIYPNAGHENYLLKYKKEWNDDVASFLTSNNLNQLPLK